MNNTPDEADWTWLKTHALRDGVILVAPGMDLVEVGRAIAADRVVEVETWVGAGKLAKPTAEQIKKWDGMTEKRFMVVVVQPYVLIQERLDS